MANTKSAIKAARKAERLTARNKGTKTRLKTLRKKFLTATQGEDKALAQRAGQQLASAMDKAAKKGIVHRNAASRAKALVSSAVFAK